ncbi:MAG: prenyltransferase/squalene oxidase repeat-containing protein [Bacteroidota bacterium]|jgi:hypothetical protein
MNKNVIDSSIQKAVDFLCNAQLGWGEFPIFGINASGEIFYRKCVFATTFILHALSFVDNTPQIQQVIKKALKFLLSEREDSGTWNYFGKTCSLIPDLDDTACVLAALAKNNSAVQSEICDQLLKYRDPSSSLFKTWIEDPPNTENDIDSIVNANILFLYGLLGKSQMIPEVVSYLIKEADILHIQSSQVWYHSPQVFSYTVSRAFNDGSVTELTPACPLLIEHLLFSQQDIGCWCNPLETAFAATALLNFSYDGDAIEPAVKYILETQNLAEGSWPADYFYINGEVGSKEITTAMCVETLIKYKLRRIGQ